MPQVLSCCRVLMLQGPVMLLTAAAGMKQLDYHHHCVATMAKEIETLMNQYSLITAQDVHCTSAQAPMLWHSMAQRNMRHHPVQLITGTTGHAKAMACASWLCNSTHYCFGSYSHPAPAVLHCRLDIQLASSWSYRCCHQSQEEAASIEMHSMLQGVLCCRCFPFAGALPMIAGCNAIQPWSTRPGLNRLSSWDLPYLVLYIAQQIMPCHTMTVVTARCMHDRACKSSCHSCNLQIQTTLGTLTLYQPVLACKLQS